MSSTAMNFMTYPAGADDPLSLLPRTPIQEFARNEVIYQPGDRAETFYLINRGRVKVSRITAAGQEVILDFLHRDDFFGETGFLGESEYGEQVTALEKTGVMAWSVGELKRLMGRTPALGAALLKVIVEKFDHQRRRIESFCQDPIQRRLAKSILDLAKRGGEQSGSEMVHLMPTTHEQLARYVGTSREIVTQHLNQFRREQLLRYSRQGMDVNLPALERFLAA